MGKSGAIKGVGADVGELLLQVLGILFGEELGALGADEEGWGLKAGEAVADGFHAEGVVAEVGPGGHAEKAEAGGGGIGVGWRSLGPDVVGFAVTCVWPMRMFRWRTRRSPKKERWRSPWSPGRRLGRNTPESVRTRARVLSGRLMA